MSKKAISVLLAVCMMLALLAGCGGNNSANAPSENNTTSQGSNTTSQDNNTPAQTDSGEPKHLNAASHMVGTSLDAAVNYQGWTVVRAGIGETLVKLSDNVELEPCVADSWSWEDEYTLKLHIRDGVTFHNGNPVNAEAVKACFEHVAETNTRFANYIDLKEFRAEGQDLTIVSNSKNPSMLWNLSEPVFSVMDMTVSDIANAPSGTGPYKVTSFVEDRIELAANENYWGGAVGLDTITFTRISDADARVMALQSGEIDMTVTIDNTSLDLFRNDSYNISLITGVRTNVVKMNVAREFLSDINVRKAISYAIDRETYSTTITGGAPSVCIFPDSVPFAIDQIEGYTYDEAKANQILDDAGYLDTDGDGIREMNGKPMHFEYYQSAAHGSSEAGLIAQAVQSDLKKIGLDVEIMSSENLSDIKKAGLYDFCSDNSNTVPTGDGQYFLNNMYSSSSSSNQSGYNNPDFDALLAKFNDAYETEERYQIAHDCAQLLVDDAADLFVTAVPMNTVSQSYVKNADQPTIDYYMITKDITIEK